MNDVPHAPPGAAALPPREARSPRRHHLARAAVIGLISGGLAVAFKHALAAGEHQRMLLLTDLHTHPAWGWAVLPLIGLFLGGGVGWLTQRLAPEAAGSGIPHLKGVLLHVRQMDWRRVLPVKFVGGVLGIGAGLSLGREGPTVQMGAAAAQAIGQILRVPRADMPQLMSAGAGAGLAAAFNAPLAGLVFVIEELHRELSSRTAAGALTAAVCATAIAHSFSGDVPSFEVRGLGALTLSSLPITILLGVTGGALGVLFNRSLTTGQSLASRFSAKHRWLLPGLAAAAIGLLAWWLPQVAGGGHILAEPLLSGRLAGTGLGTLALLLLAKFLVTILSYSTGAPGGIFAPMLLLGALLGTIVAGLLPRIDPGLQVPATTLAVLGMAAVFAGSVRASLTGIVLISELTGGYTLLFPLCVVVLVAYLTAEALRDPPLYDALLEADLARRGHALHTPEPRSVYIGVQNGSPLAGKPLAQAGLPRGCLATAIDRAGRAVVPSAQTVILPGDHITVLCPGEQPEAPLELVRLCTGI